MTSIPTTTDGDSTPGDEMFNLAARLFPIHRSQTGNGVRQSLEILSESIPLTAVEVPTGTQALGWTIPQEWNIADAYIAGPNGKRLIDYGKSNLHVVAGSCPISQLMTWTQLEPHLIVGPADADWIPFRTNYFENDWGFCVSSKQYHELKQVADDDFQVVVDSRYSDGSLTYGELYIPGDSADEVFIATHLCHPSLANDGLSGVVLATELAKWVASAPRRYSYRFLFNPATIGAIAWLHNNRDCGDRIRHGLVLSCLGDSGPFHYRKSRRDNCEIDRTVTALLEDRDDRSAALPFEPFGYDQRQYCSPGFDLPVGCLMRTPNACYPEYHTSADNLDLISAESLQDSFELLVNIVSKLEAQASQIYVNPSPFGEPRLGEAGLYEAFGRESNSRDLQRACLWVLNLSDGVNSLWDISERSHLPISLVSEALEILKSHDFLRLRPDTESRVAQWQHGGPERRTSRTNEPARSEGHFARNTL